MTKIVLICLVSSLVCLQAFTQPADTKADAVSAVILNNPGFEDTYRDLPPPAEGAKAQIKGALANGWVDNSDWADIAVDYGAETTNPHGGKTSQRVAISRVTDGAVQLAQAVHFQGGHEYSFRVWVRGEPGGAISILLRQATEPYNTYAETPVTLTPEWREISVSGMVPDETDGFLMFLSNKAATFWIDDARLEDKTKAPAR